MALNAKNTAPVDGCYDAVAEAAHQWRAALWSGRATAADKLAFTDWLDADPAHEAAYARAATVWAALGELKEQDMVASIKRPTLQENYVGFEDRLRAIAGLRPAFGYGVLGCALAAAVAIAVPVLQPAAPVLMPNQEVALALHRSEIGEVRDVTLQDGTQVTLGPASEIEVAYSQAKRSIQLKSGAALFDVQKDPERPFEVEAGGLTAIALGTVFEVRSSGGISRVGVAEGRVGVSFPLVVGGDIFDMRERKELAAGQQIMASDYSGLAGISTIPIATVGAFRDKRLVYERATLGEILADAKRYSSIPIDYDGSAGERFRITASFRGEALDQLFAKLPKLFPVVVDSSDSAVIRIRMKDAATP